MTSRFKKTLLIFLLLYTKIVCSKELGYVTVSLKGQWGNQLFQIATAYAYALDHQIPLLIPDYQKSTKIFKDGQRIFAGRICMEEPSFPAALWKEPSFSYHPIPSSSCIRLYGYFQSEKYFEHRKEEIQKLFAPPLLLQQEIERDFLPLLQSNPWTVAVQIRDYRKENLRGHPTHGRDYYKQAFSLFPDDALFIVSSNHRAFAKECTEGLKPHILYLNEQSALKEFYILSLCKSFILSNSSFGWWAAWLSPSTQKTCIFPSPWFSAPYPQNKEKDLLPKEAIVISARPVSL